MQFVVFDSLVIFLRFITRVFFRTVEVTGDHYIPARGPVILVGNHPNSLLDPVLITTSATRRVRFAAKDTLFDSRMLKVLLKSLGAVPIRRRQDHGEGLLDNTAAFDALFEILRAGDVFGIFPEGISHAKSELAPLKTGAARIAFGALQEGTPLVIVPCGLTYKRRERMRSRVLVQYGMPIDVDDALRAQFEVDPKAAAQELTDRIDTALRALTINVPDFETLRVLDGVRRLYRPRGRRLSLTERAEITRRLMTHWERLKDEPAIHALYSDVESYQFKLSALGLRDHDLLDEPSRLTWVRKVAQHLLLFFVWLPLALPGLFIHAPVLVAAVFAGDALTARKDVRSTTKVMVATVLSLTAYAVVVAAAVYLGGLKSGLITGGVTVLGLLASGWATIRVLERQSVLRRGFMTMMLIIDMKHEIKRLRDTRDALRTRVLELVTRFIDPDLERVVSADEQRP